MFGAKGLVTGVTGVTNISKTAGVWSLLESGVCWSLLESMVLPLPHFLDVFSRPQAMG